LLLRIPLLVSVDKVANLAVVLVGVQRHPQQTYESDSMGSMVL
jgi:hypothetical protein